MQLALWDAANTGIRRTTLASSISGLLSFLQGASLDGELISIILLEAKGGHGIQFWPINGEREFTEQSLGMVCFPGERSEHDCLCSHLRMTRETRGVADRMQHGVGEPREMKLL